jgi:probable phosphoglycerate mutase
MSTTEFIIVRHGQTPWNVERRIQGWRDIDLNDVGHQQAQLLAEHLLQSDNKHLAIEAIYSSDLARARQTAQAIAQALNLPLELVDGLRERNYGVLEGVLFDLMHQHHPELAQVWQSRDPDGVIPEAETLRTFTSRVKTAIETLTLRHPKNRVMVVTHGGAMDILWRAATGTPIEAPRSAPLLNASINRISVTPTDQGFQWSLIEWGNVTHLEDADDDATAQ